MISTAIQRARQSLACALITWSGAALAQSHSPWQILASDDFASVYAERQLYSDTGKETLYIHVRVYPKYGQKLGVDTRNPFKLFYPNQWEISATPSRSLIDEERMSPKPLTSEQRDQLVTNFQAGALTPVGKYFDYYRAFFGKAPNPEQLIHGKYLIISLDGELLFTNGKNTDVLTLEWIDGRGPKDTDLVFPTESKPKPLPAGAKIFAQ